MNFQELLDALRGDDPPETIYDDLSGAYQNVVDGAAAAKVDSDNAIAALNDEIAKLKSQNFDLLMASQSAPAEPEVESDTEDDAVDEPEDHDNLFEYERTN